MATKMDREKLWQRLSRDFDSWIKMDDATLLAEAKRVWPAITQATRDECFKVLVMSYVQQMI